MLIRRKGLEERRRELPDTVGKTSLFVKAILERYGQDGEYRFDPASLVYLLPERPQEEGTEKKEPEEERVREYVLRERETVKLATHTERTRDFVTRVMERTAIPSGVELLQRHSLRQQILVQTRRLLMECRETERELLHEQNETRTGLVQRIQELFHEADESARVTAESYEPDVNGSYEGSYEADIQNSREALTKKITGLLKEAARENRQRESLTDMAGELAGNIPGDLLESGSEELAHRITELIYETQTEYSQNEININHVTTRNQESVTRDFHEALTERIAELLKKTAGEIFGQKIHSSGAGRPDGAFLHQRWNSPREVQSEGSRSPVRGEVSGSVGEPGHLAENISRNLAENIPEELAGNIPGEPAESGSEELAYEIAELVYETWTGYVRGEGRETDITDELREGRGPETWDSGEVFTEKITRLLKEAVRENRQRESLTDMAGELAENIPGELTEIDSEELAHRITELIHETRTEYSQNEININHVTTRNQESVTRNFLEVVTRDFHEALTERIAELLKETAVEVFSRKIHGSEAGRPDGVFLHQRWNGPQEGRSEGSRSPVRGEATGSTGEPGGLAGNIPRNLAENIPEELAGNIPGEPAESDSEELAYEIAELVYETWTGYVRGEGKETDITDELREGRGPETWDSGEVFTEKITRLLKEAVRESRQRESLTDMAGELAENIPGELAEIDSEKLAHQITELIHETQTEYSQNEINISHVTTRNQESVIRDFHEALTERIAELLKETAVEVFGGEIHGSGAGRPDGAFLHQRWNGPREVQSEGLRSPVRGESTGEPGGLAGNIPRNLAENIPEELAGNIPGEPAGSDSEELAYEIAELVYETWTGYVRGEGRETDITDELREGRGPETWDSGEVITEKITRLLKEAVRENGQGGSPADMAGELAENIPGELTENGSEELARRITELIHETRTEYSQNEINISHVTTRNQESVIRDFHEALTERIAELLKETAVEVFGREIHGSGAGRPDGAFLHQRWNGPREVQSEGLRSPVRGEATGEPEELAGNIPGEPAGSDSEELAYEIAELVYETWTGYVRGEGRETDITDELREGRGPETWDSVGVLTEKITGLLKEAVRENRQRGNSADMAGELAENIPGELTENGSEELAHRITELIYETRTEYSQNKINVSHGTTCESVTRDFHEALTERIAELLKETAVEVFSRKIHGSEAERPDGVSLHQRWNGPQEGRSEGLRSPVRGEVTGSIKEPEELARQIIELVYGTQAGYLQSGERKTGIADGTTEVQAAALSREQPRPEVSETIREFQKEIHTLEKMMEGWREQDDSVLEARLPKMSKSVQRLIEYRRILGASEDYVWPPLFGETEALSPESVRHTAELVRIQTSESERILEIHQNSGQHEPGSEEKSSSLQYYEEHSKKLEQLQKEQRELIRRLEERTARQGEQFQKLKVHHEQLREQLENSQKHFSENTEQKTLQKFQERFRLERMRRGLA